MSEATSQSSMVLEARRFERPPPALKGKFHPRCRGQFRATAHGNECCAEDSASRRRDVEAAPVCTGSQGAETGPPTPLVRGCVSAGRSAAQAIAARGARLAVDNGILVDDRLRAGVPGVFAAGDVANAHHPHYGERVRVEHWANALNQGPAAARSMLGNEEPYDKIPYFFSDQYDVGGMEYAGLATSFDRIVYRGEPASREFIAFWLAGDRLVAGMNVNVWDVSDEIQRLIRDRVAVDDRALADDGVALSDLT